MHPLIAPLYAAVLQFGVGTLFATLLSDWRGEVTPGFLRQGAALAAVGAALAWLLVGGAPLGERLLAWGVLLASLGYLVLQFSGRRRARLRIGSIGAAVGLAGLAMAALDRPSPVLGAGWTALASGASALALGSATAALVLGHWYLVTPRLSARPLRLLCDLAIGALAILTGFAVWYVSINPRAIVGPDDALYRWTTVLAVTVFPLGVTAAARVCCQEWPRGRAIQAATGLLYVTAALVLAGALAGNMVMARGVG